MFLTRLFACFITLTSMSMAAVAAWDRGGTMVDRTLLVALSIAIIAAAHLLPAVSRRPASWFLWVGCVLCAIYGHLIFFTNSSMRASDVRVETSRDLVGVERQIEATKTALTAISARPTSVIAYEMATENKWRAREALRIELIEAKRADVLRDKLVTLSSNASNAGVTAATDPVTTLLSSVTGKSSSAILLFIGVFFSVLLELVGALVWYEAINGTTKKPERVTSISSQTVASAVDAAKENMRVATGIAEPEMNPSELVGPAMAANDDAQASKNPEFVMENLTDYEGEHDNALLDLLKQLRLGLDAGQCKPTVASIRTFLNCGQHKALALRRIVMPAGSEA